LDVTPRPIASDASIKWDCDNRWKLPVQKPIRFAPHGTLTVSVKDRQGNLTTVE
jgi:hypothetical protein